MDSIKALERGDRLRLGIGVFEETLLVGTYCLGIGMVSSLIGGHIACTYTVSDELNMTLEHFHVLYSKSAWK